MIVYLYIVTKINFWKENLIKIHRELKMVVWWFTCRIKPCDWTVMNEECTRVNYKYGRYTPQLKIQKIGQYTEPYYLLVQFLDRFAGVRGGLSSATVMQFFHGNHLPSLAHTLLQTTLIARIWVPTNSQTYVSTVEPWAGVL